MLSYIKGGDRMISYEKLVKKLRGIGHNTLIEEPVINLFNMYMINFQIRYYLKEK